ncbi:MAG TPA: transposase [Desulfosporosinus sp.]|nr:transposase [Desulfosporosinus sp.]
MPRKPRKKSETGIYHVIVRGIGQQDIFHEEDDFQRYLDTTKKVSLESGVSVLGYCLMTNHVHLLLRDDYGDISVFMKRLGISYAYWYNWKYERIGHVFQDRFKSECVEDDEYLLTVIRYIHENPVKASIISKPEEYKWSSCTPYYNADRNTATFPDTSLILSIVHNDKKKAIEGLKKFTEEGNEDHCLDCDKTKRISESEAYEITKGIMKGKPVTALQKMDQDARNKILSRLRNDGLSLRQICRITGLPFHIVRKA